MHLSQHKCCALGQWSLHSRWNFISTFTELHVRGDQRWPTEVTSNTYFRDVKLIRIWNAVRRNDSSWRFERYPSSPFLIDPAGIGWTPTMEWSSVLWRCVLTQNASGSSSSPVKRLCKKWRAEQEWEKVNGEGVTRYILATTRASSNGN